MDNAIRTTLADDGTVTVTVLGEIDFSSADTVAEGIRDAIVDWSPSAVRVDLRDASFIDSTGLGALIESYRDAQDRGIGFTVVNPNENFRHVLSVTGLSEFFGLLEPADESMPAEPGRAQATGA
ncbi:STAS domain-containing protein [Actinoplanes sp. DH11]|uniref:STAS domain-containing protein n=1 Tax=Actinoplanes sp. DH11 TaxID=2857011 RepID=UPI001E42140A|nr:STAS domain-containing protein [Actinoplanes sp. DH11]